jgi:hypothetical protein
MNTNEMKKTDVLEKIERLLTMCERDQLTDWADLGARVYLLRSEVKQALGVYDMRALPVRRCQIICKTHPEWGTWGVYEDHGGYYDIHGDSGGRILDKSEAVKFWEVVK